MGYIHELDTGHEHEGWVCMTYADGKLSSGTSSAQGYYLDGYTYTEDGEIDPSFLRPSAEIVGWLPRCECGWTGIAVPVIGTGTDADRWREPTGEQEDLLMSQWRLHMRETVGAYQSESSTL